MFRLITTYSLCLCLLSCSSVGFLVEKKPSFVKGLIENTSYCFVADVCISFPGVIGPDSFLHKDRVSIYFTVRNKIHSTLGFSVNLRKGAPVDKIDYFQKTIKDIEKKNSRRKELLRGSLEERWEEVDNHEFIREQAYSRGRHHYHMGNAPGDEKERQRIKEIYIEQLMHKRIDLQGLPYNSYKKVRHKGLECLYVRRYTRLPGRRAVSNNKYRKSTAGGINSIHGYGCYVNSRTTLSIALDSNAPPGESFDADRILNKVFNTLELNSGIPGYNSSFDQWLAEEYKEDSEK